MFKAKPFHFCLALILAVFIILSLLVFWRIHNLFLVVGTANSVDQPKEVNIPLNSSTAQIAAILQQEGVIKNGLLFRFYAQYKGYDQKLQAGTYSFYPGMSYEDVLDKLQQGVVWAESVRFTIPEGFTVEQIAARLEKEGLANKENFLDLCLEYRQEPHFDFLEEVPVGVEYPLEGYLFPDTYEIYRTATPRDIVTAMLRRFDEVFDGSFRLRANELGFSIHEIITIASLVEKEAKVPQERPLISAVFHNRLQSENMPLLQSCATVQYVLGETKPELTYKDLEIDSPYNTYLYPNLPPGPIASPGREALEAALCPAHVDYLYFVYKEDGSGEHFFSATLQEHERYKELARKNKRQR